MTEKWFENWLIEEIPFHKVKKLRITLPNSATEKQPLVIIQGKKLTKRQITELSGILTSAFHQIQSDNGGYKK